MGEPGTIGAGKDGAATVESSGFTDVASDGPASEEISRKSRWNRRIALIGGLIALIAAAVVLPPLINIGRYQHRITALMSRSMGRPVYMSSVELRLLPRPGFVLHDLSVSEDPGFGAEPILSARTVVASIRILSLWRGRLEIDRVSVDEASLNIVRSAEGRWNLDSLLMGARPALTGEDANPSGKFGGRLPGSSAHFPYLEATDSRVNLKNGIEKSPFSLVNTDLSLWQDEPGAWRVRLRGQPVRTDMEMSSADTGEVRMEASLHSAAQLREMPLQLQMEWREAQLGQLSRLILGSDAGWRGDVTADIEVKGTPDSAQTKARLRAVGVRREEFAPGTPLDFDANCNFLYQHSQNAFHNLGCDTAIGDGRLHLTAELPGNGGKPEAMLEVSQIPLQAGLDLLRTVRSGFAPGISAKGTANGSLTYKVMDAEVQRPKKPLRHAAPQKLTQTAAGPDSAGFPANLHGALTVDGGQLKGGELKEPLIFPKIVLTPALLSDSAQQAAADGNGTGLGTRFTIVLAPATPALPAASPAASSRPSRTQASAAPPPAAAAAQAITVRLGLGASRYDAVVSGSAGTARLRDLAYAFGLSHLDAVDGFAGGTADFDFTAAGPWIASRDAVAISQPVSSASSASSTGVKKAAAKTSGSASTTATVAEALPGQDSVSGSLELHHSQWKAVYLARPVDLTQATLTVSTAKIAFASDFSYGGQKSATKDSSNAAKDLSKEAGPDLVRGSVLVNAAANCKADGSGDVSSQPATKAGGCEPQIELRFGALDANMVQTALMGAPEEKTLFSPLMDRMRSSDRPKWPEVAVHVKAESLVLGAITLQKPVILMRFKPSEVVLESWEADLLGGSAKGTGHFAWADNKPEYSFEGSFSGIGAAAAGELLEAQWAGGPVSGSGNLKLSGLIAKELAASAAGNLRFDWRRGAISLAGAASEETRPQETKFDDWSGAVSIEGGKARVGANQLLLGKHSSSVAGVIPFGGPVRLSLAPAETKLVAHTPQPASPPAVK